MVKWTVHKHLINNLEHNYVVKIVYEDSFKGTISLLSNIICYSHNYSKNDVLAPFILVLKVNMDHA